MYYVFTILYTRWLRNFHFPCKSIYACMTMYIYFVITIFLENLCTKILKVEECLS